jgi:hypothetical protein
MNFLIPRFLVDTGDLINLSVTTPKLADDAVTEVKEATRRAWVYDINVQSIPNAAFTALQFASESYDNGSIHDNAVNNSRLTVPSTYTLARVSAYAIFSSAAGGIRRMRLYKNGVEMSPPVRDTANDLGGGAVIPLRLASPWMVVVAGDYFEIMVDQNSGAALNINAGGDMWASMEVKK